MSGYDIEHTPTESSNGGILLYMKQEINYKLRKDLKLISLENLDQLS